MSKDEIVHIIYVLAHTRSLAPWSVCLLLQKHVDFKSHFYHSRACLLNRYKTWIIAYSSYFLAYLSFMITACPLVPAKVLTMAYIYSYSQSRRKNNTNIFRAESSILHHPESKAINMVSQTNVQIGRFHAATRVHHSNQWSTRSLSSTRNAAYALLCGMDYSFLCSFQISDVERNLGSTWKFPTSDRRIIQGATSVTKLNIDPGDERWWTVSWDKALIP